MLAHRLCESLTTNESVAACMRQVFAAPDTGEDPTVVAGPVALEPLR